MTDHLSMEELRVLFKAARLSTDDATLSTVLPNLVELRSALARLRELPLGEMDPAYEFQLDPGVWR